MAVAYVTDGDVTGNAVSSITTPSITVSGTDKVVVSSIAFEETTLTSASGGSASWAAVASTSTANGSRNVAMWRGIAPSDGSQTFTATFGDSDGNGLSLCAVQYSGADQTTPCQNGNTATGAAGTDPSVTVASVAADDFVQDSVRHGDATVGANQTSRAAPAGGYGYCSTQEGADGGVMSWTRNDDIAWATGACRIVAAGAGGRTTRNTRAWALGMDLGMNLWGEAA